MALIELAGVVGVGPALVAPGVVRRIDLHGSLHAGEVVVVDVDVEVTAAQVLDRDRCDRVTSGAIREVDAERVGAPVRERPLQELDQLAGCVRRFHLLEVRQHLPGPAVGDLALQGGHERQ
jgi:hypothetical protein